MDEKIDRAIENLVLMIRPNIKQDDALKFTQSVLNMAHAKAILEGRVSPKKQGASA